MKLCSKFQIEILKKVRQKRNKDQSWSFLRFLLHFSIFFTFNFVFFSKASQLSCEVMFKMLSKNIDKCIKEKIEEITNFGLILISPFLLNLCHSQTVHNAFNYIHLTRCLCAWSRAKERVLVRATHFSTCKIDIVSLLQLYQFSSYHECLFEHVLCLLIQF